MSSPSKINHADTINDLAKKILENQRKRTLEEEKDNKVIQAIAQMLAGDGVPTHEQRAEAEQIFGVEKAATSLLTSKPTTTNSPLSPTLTTEMAILLTQQGSSSSSVVLDTQATPATSACTKRLLVLCPNWFTTKMVLPINELVKTSILVINDAELNEASKRDYGNNSYLTALTRYLDAIHGLINGGAPRAEVKSFHHECFQRLRCGEFDIINTPLSSFHTFVGLQNAAYTQKGSSSYGSSSYGSSSYARQPYGNPKPKNFTTRPYDNNRNDNNRYDARNSRKRDEPLWVKNTGQCPNHPATKNAFIEDGHTESTCFRNKSKRRY